MMEHRMCHPILRLVERERGKRVRREKGREVTNKKREEIVINEG